MLYIRIKRYCVSIFSRLFRIQSLGAVWESRWPSWAFRPNEPYGFCGSKATVNHASALVTVCPWYIKRHPRTWSSTSSSSPSSSSSSSSWDMRHECSESAREQRTDLNKSDQYIYIYILLFLPSCLLRVPGLSTWWRRPTSTSTTTLARRRPSSTYTTRAGWRRSGAIAVVCPTSSPTSSTTSTGTPTSPPPSPSTLATRTTGG